MTSAIVRGSQSRSQPWQPRRDHRLRRLGFETHSDYLASPLWDRKRAQWFASGRSYRCGCGQPAVVLHHHTRERLGAEDLDDLVALCASCYDTICDLQQRGITGLSAEGLKNAAQAAVYEEQLRQHHLEIEYESHWRGLFRCTWPGIVWSCGVGLLEDRFAKRYGPDERVLRDLSDVFCQIHKIEGRLIRIQKRCGRDRFYRLALANVKWLHEHARDNRHPREPALWALAAEKQAFRVVNGEEELKPIGPDRESLIRPRLPGAVSRHSPSGAEPFERGR